MKRIQKSAGLFVPVLLLLMLFSACGTEKKLSKKALEELRDHYPYCATANVSMATLPEELWVKGYDVFAVVELAGDRAETITTLFPNPSVDPSLSTDVTTYYYPLKVVEILDIRDGCSLDEKEVTLSFPGLFYDSKMAFNVGQKLVVFGSLDKSENTEETVIGIGAVMSFYLTDYNYVMSLSHHAQMEQFSGWKLDAFKNEMLRIAKKGGWHK